MKNILVVAAHPDDEVLGCGGTMSRLSEEGAVVHVRILATGGTARGPLAEESDVRELRESTSRALSLLGVTGTVKHFDLPDNAMDTVALLDVVRIIEGAIDETQPSTVFTHHFGDLNVDHQLTARAVLTASRPQPGCLVKEVLAWETASSTEWAFGGTQSSFEPNVFHELGLHLDRKLKALGEYSQELRSWPHPRSIDGIRALAHLRGSAAGFDSAEAFTLMRSVNGIEDSLNPA